MNYVLATAERIKDANDMKNFDSANDVGLVKVAIQDSRYSRSGKMTTKPGYLMEEIGETGSYRYLGQGDFWIGDALQIGLA